MSSMLVAEFLVCLCWTNGPLRFMLVLVWPPIFLWLPGLLCDLFLPLLGIHLENLTQSQAYAPFSIGLLISKTINYINLLSWYATQLRVICYHKGRAWLCYAFVTLLVAARQFLISLIVLLYTVFISKIVGCQSKGHLIM